MAAVPLKRRERWAGKPKRKPGCSKDVDPHWNPSTDNQAVCRAYRIGQTKSVIVYRLITCGTIEEKIYRRQVFKESLIKQTMGNSEEDTYRYFTSQELRHLFKLEDTEISVTQKQLEGLHAWQRKSSRELDQHIAFLKPIVSGISDHDLLFSLDCKTLMAKFAEYDAKVSVNGIHSFNVGACA
ncbi:DNA excision repair protein ERCC-6-like [Lytechinus pictus]|uniref:DNA excision repair protein ERCC-6-like n=1 Tax=Lytechinus pictus TaxID=7653 RepID=UPI0030B9BC51